jgi:hypothetical protein
VKQATIGALIFLAGQQTLQQLISIEPRKYPKQLADEGKEKRREEKRRE